MTKEKIEEIKEAMRKTAEQATQSKEAALAFLERANLLRYMGPPIETSTRQTLRKSGK